MQSLALPFPSLQLTFTIKAKANDKYFRISSFYNQFITPMKNHPQKLKKSRRYAKISLIKRKKLIVLVIEKSMIISKASKQLNIKLSTAKLIISRFKELGTYFERKQDKQMRLAEIIPSEIPVQSVPDIVSEAIYQQMKMAAQLDIDVSPFDWNTNMDQNNQMFIGNPDYFYWRIFPNFNISPLSYPYYY